MIVVETVRGGDFIYHCEPRARAFRHRDCYGAVQGHDGRGLDALQLIVEADDLGPVRVRRVSSLTMHRGDRCLQGEWARRAARRALYEKQALGDLLLVPEAAVLFL